jgi:hypothetical protein
MKMKYTLFILTLFITFTVNSQSKKSSYIFDLCEAESGLCQRKCKVEVVKGNKLELGSYIKVYIDKALITEGYILKHVSGQVFILISKQDASNPDVCGGCCGETYSIDIKKKQIWGC